MFDLERAITDWRRRLHAAGIESSEALDELECHLRDDLEARMRSGLSAEQAFTAAVRDIGDAGSLKREFEKHGSRQAPLAGFAKLFVVGLAGAAVLTGVTSLFKLPFSPELPLSGFGFGFVLSAFVWLLSSARISTMPTSSSLDTSLFTPSAKQSLDAARVEATRFHHTFIGTEHALLGLFEPADGIVAKVLRNCGLERGTVRTEIEKLVGVGPVHQPSCDFPCTPRLKRAVALAAREASEMKHDRVGPEHLFLGLLVEGQGVAGIVLRSLGISVEAARAAILRETGGAGGEPTAAS